MRCDTYFERQARSAGFVRIAGVDEAGRGALFGPVFAAAVILDPERPIHGLQDSKVLDPETRQRLAAEIRARALAWAVAAADCYEVDRINIYQASRLAMRRAALRLEPPADFLLVDAVRVDLPLPQKAIIHGDARSRSIAAASILAKVERDACLLAWASLFPQYGLERHKGYGTPEHLRALEQFGPTCFHRHTYEPIRRVAGCEPMWEQIRLFAETDSRPCQ